MKIVVLDGYALNPGDLDWDGLSSVGDLTVFDRSADDEVVLRSAGADIVLTNKVALTEAVISKLPDLKYIGVLATGYNIVDLEAAKERGVMVTNVPLYATESVAQSVFAHLLNLTLRYGDHVSSVSDGKWSECPDFCYWEYPLVEIAGMTMGIIGFGRIGRAVARVAKGFGMDVMANDAQDVPGEEGVRLVELDTLLVESDVVTLHCQLTEDNRGLINAEKIALMKSTAYLVNTSRGPLVDESTLADALNSGKLAGAGLDVLVDEPPLSDNPLLTARNCFITPHIAWATKAARTRLLATVVENIKAFQNGTSQNVVN